jgi:exopolysaccharide biosynthesis polyprenyl glycosylphosphotransferase
MQPDFTMGTQTLPRTLPSRIAQWRMYRATLVAVDVLALVLAFGLAYWLRFGVNLPLLRTEVVGDLDFYRQAAVVIIPLWLLLFAALGLYSEANLLGGTREYALVFNAVTAGVVVVVLGTFLSQGFVLARAWVVLSWALGFLSVATARFCLRRGVYHMRSRGWFLSSTLIVGTNAEALSLADQLGHWRSSGLQVLGLVSTTPELVGTRVRQLPVVADLANVGEIIDRYGVEEVVVATSAVHRADLVDIFRELGTREDVELRLSGGLYEVLTTGLTIKEMGFVPLINVEPARLTGGDWVLKSFLDIGVSLVTLALLWPLYLALALAVKLDSPGPVLHRRRVLGMGGREFYAYKFRTMVCNGHEVLAADPALAAELASDHKLKDDPRVTRLGRVLRKYSLDELPQVFNVLAGDMSIVGPRMISPEEHAKYGSWDLNLLTVKPGITGLWQVSGRSDLSYDERVRLDMNYIRNWTIWLDLQILLQTIPAVLFGRGAY